MSKKILVVDDDVDILEHVALILKDQGYDVVQAEGQHAGEEAIISTIPDLAILDLIMEKMDSGFILCHEIKRLYPGTPVIILTAANAAIGLDFIARTDTEASWIKADAVLDKPVRAEQLITEVARLLQA